MNNRSILSAHLMTLYGTETGAATLDRLVTLIDQYRAQIPTPHALGLTSREAILITYGDQVREPNVPPLQTLAGFCDRYLTEVVSAIHLLPFYPYSSDDGFSVIDYRAVNPELGTWDDVARFRPHFRLMFDAVVNHISAQSEWFQRFLRDDPQFRDYFIVVPDGADVSRVIRPRTLPLLTHFETPSGEKNVWTTFSADQIDLNYHNPEVLLNIVDALLFYVAHGAEFIRLDAIAFLWKELGTTCLHLPQTHRVVQLFRAVLDEIAPHVALITETNVPHAENLSYFGNGTNEAQLVYNFALPPLVLHTLHTGNAEMLTRWASSLARPSKQVTFFNFLASHDGIGLNPARGILSDAEIDALVEKTLAHGGLVSYKNNPDGTTSPYELNLNYFDALSSPEGDERFDLQIDRFIASQAIMLALVGVPGIYFHSLFGSRGWPEGVARNGYNRAINREKCARATLERELNDAQSRRARVFARYRQLLQARAAHPAFDPYGEQQVIFADAAVFGVLRKSPDGRDPVLCLQNVSNERHTIQIETGKLFDATPAVTDLVTSQLFAAARGETIELKPYQVLWLTPRSRR